jgi:hypothetical protein
MRSQLIALVCVTVCAGPVGVQGSDSRALPTFSLLGEVNIAAHGITPTDIAYSDGELFVSCFGANRQIVRISGALTTNPQVSTFAVTAGPGALPAANPALDGPVDWAEGRGLTSIDVNKFNGHVLVAGDPGSGPLAVIEYDMEGNLVKLMDIPDAPVSYQRINAARYFADNGVLFGSIFGTVLHAGGNLDELVDPYSVGGWPNYTRGIAFSGDDIYIRTTSNGEDRLQRLTGGTLGWLGNYYWEGEPFAIIGPMTFNTSSGIQSFTHAGTTKYVVANKASAPVGIQFYDPSTPVENTPTTPVFVLDDVFLGTGQLLALGFATTDEGQFMFVGRTGTPAATNSIQIYGIDGAELTVVSVGTLGDINDDGAINVADVTELANLVAANTPPAIEVGDINGDATVDESDVEALAAQIVE